MKPDQKHLLQVQICEQEMVKIDVDVKYRTGQLKETVHSSQRELSQISKEIRDKIKQMEDKVDWLETLANNLRKTAERDEVLSQVRKHRQEIDHNGQELRRATLTAVEALDRETRRALFQTSSDQSIARQRNTQARNLGQQSSQVTESLTRLVSQMNDQVVQSEMTLGTLVGSSNLITDTETEFGSMGATIQTSGKLLSKYSHRELTDKILVFLALCVFFGACIYVVKQRLFPNGFW